MENAKTVDEMSNAELMENLIARQAKDLDQMSDEALIQYFLSRMSMDTAEYFLARSYHFCDAHGMSPRQLAIAAIKKTWAVALFRNIENAGSGGIEPKSPTLETLLKVDQYMEDNPVGE